MFSLTLCCKKRFGGSFERGDRVRRSTNGREMMDVERSSEAIAKSDQAFRKELRSMQLLLALIP